MRGERVALLCRVSRQLAVSLPVINVVSAALTFVLIAYVVPLPGPAPPAKEKTTALVVMVVVTGFCWMACDLWGRYSLIPIRDWLRGEDDPTESQRSHTLKMPLHEATHTFVIWILAGVGFAALDLAENGTVAAAIVIVVIVVLGGLIASALTYLVTEWIMRPVTALALESGPAAQRWLPGIATRIYLAWEFGTAVAVGGTVVVAAAYLAGGTISGRRLATTVIFLGGLALTIGLVTLLAAIHSVARPVRALRGAMARVEAGETDITVPVDDGGEVGLLQAGFNRMVAGLRERDQVRDLFGRHVGEEVARSALRRGLELGGELREAAVLFIDVVGSTTFAATRDPRQVVDTLNRFFGIVVEVVTVHGGWVNKFEGDAALCVFGAPVTHPDAAGAALCAARELNERLTRELMGVEAAIGLSAGTVVAGNIGAARRYEYTVIGDPVNEAARLTELAKSGESRVLASESIIGSAAAGEAHRWRLGDLVVLRGRVQPTRIAAPA